MQMFQNLLACTLPQRIINATAAGTTTITSSAVDTINGAGVLFVLFLGTLTATNVTTIKVQQSDDDGSTDTYDDVAGSAVASIDTQSNNMLAIDVSRPMKRYLKLVVTRATANAVLDGAIAIQYNPTLAPPTQHSTLYAKKTLNQPAEGTP